MGVVSPVICDLPLTIPQLSPDPIRGLGCPSVSEGSPDMLQHCTLNSYQSSRSSFPSLQTLLRTRLLPENEHMGPWQDKGAVGQV